jgi:hypothetical protein
MIARQSLACGRGKGCGVCRSNRTFGSIRREMIAIEKMAEA